MRSRGWEDDDAVAAGQPRVRLVDTDPVTRQLDAVYAAEDSSLDPILAEIQHRTIREVTPRAQSLPESSSASSAMRWEKPTSLS